MTFSMRSLTRRSFTSVDEDILRSGRCFGEGNTSVSARHSAPWSSHHSDFPRYCLLQFRPFSHNALFNLFIGLLKSMLPEIHQSGFFSFFTCQITRSFTWFASELHTLLIMEVIYYACFGLIYIISWLSYILAFGPLHFFKGGE